MKFATRQKVFIIAVILVVVVSLGYVIVKTYVDPALPFGVNDDKFQDYLVQGEYEKAKQYWDATLARFSDEAKKEQINARFSSYLKTHLQYMDVYCSSSDFSAVGFHNQYGDIADLGNYVADSLMIAASKTVVRYANMNVSYTQAKAVVVLLCDMLGDTASKTTMLTALDSHRQIQQQYLIGLEYMQSQNYIRAIQTMSAIEEHTDEESYVHYLATQNIKEAVEAVKVEADEYAGDRDYKTSAALLEQLCALTNDEEGQKMLKRVYNILYPAY